MEIAGAVRSAGRPQARLTGTETSSAGKFAVACIVLSKLPTIGEGLVVPQDSRFMDLEGGGGDAEGAGGDLASGATGTMIPGIVLILFTSGEALGLCRMT
jgi:hypothetical protein